MASALTKSELDVSTQLSTAEALIRELLQQLQSRSAIALAEEGVAQASQLLADARKSIRALDRELETWNGTLRDADDRLEYNKHVEEVERLRMLTGQTVLRLKVLQDKRSACERSSLFVATKPGAAPANETTGLRHRAGATVDASAARAAEKTAALERVHALMSMELERMAAIGDVMDHDSKVLKAVSEGHTLYASDAQEGKAQISRYRQRALTNLIMTWASFLFFIATVVYIWYRRFIRA